MFVNRLREKIESGPANPRRLPAEPTVGNRFQA
jgi:hypothetical protein